MKIILSRKGFDQGSGGAPSPLFPDGSMFSIPIPDGRTRQRYGAMRHREHDIGEIVSHLTKGRYTGRSSAHVDPDLHKDRIERLEGWRPAFGQTGAAQRHLENQGVGLGDIFLFFGWFRDVSKSNGVWRPTPGGRDIHAFHGWMQVGEVLDLSSGRATDWLRYPWLCNHPHVGRGAEPNNTIYIATETLALPGGIGAGRAGGGRLEKLTAETTLTAPDQPKKSVWSLPEWFGPDSGRSLSYHVDRNRWTMTPTGLNLKTVGRGQEFVIDIGDDKKALNWVSFLISSAI
ncbi:hypothetical protein OIU34_18975 [Pararhizobium sp. BT-229]|uniref:Nmad3 family putative nucleotide modification protein n=1 Tax=Pararhizobium sp. BT-229 TaxID=2986923 RepID=UPI0021F6CB04|nr:hypothetical protein [Pararhizobium sp. BT-229]MCV9963965.1 hypothetical protein [Pararhizobium sp. BT-229]